jgi:predicted dienelactone hydrolase
MLYALLVAAAFMLATVFGGCSSDSGSQVPTTPFDPSRYAERGEFGVGVTTLEFVDLSRPTEVNRDFAGADERRLPVEVWYPAGPSSDAPEQRDATLDRSGAPFPLIVFAHGYSATNRQSPSYTQHLASRGYIVASINFPLSSAGAPGGPRISAVLDQPGDVSFVIDSLLALEEGHALAGAIDAEAIGMTGHSLGGLTTLLTAYGEDRDERLRAVAPISPPACFIGDGFAASSIPIMVIGGSKELIVSPTSIRRAYDIAPPPRYHAELIGADHIRFADVAIEDSQLPGIVDTIARGDLDGDATRIADALSGDTASCAMVAEANADTLLAAERQRELLRIYATPFFDAYLRHDEDALRFLQETLPDLAEARFEFQVK